MRLNKYIAHSGYCSRRNADKFILDRKVFVNDKLISDPATFVTEADTITIENHQLSLLKENIYFVLNKPLQTVTTTNDEKNRPTVIDLINTDSRIYPIGRLDYMTTGILLLTNDGALTQKLSHPSTEIKKTYLVELEGEIKPYHVKELEDGIVIDDQLTYPAKISHISYRNNSSQFHIEIHEGRNRQIRRMISTIGYKLLSLDRIDYAGISYSKLTRGDYRELTKFEITKLKKLAGII